MFLRHAVEPRRCSSQRHVIHDVGDVTGQVPSTKYRLQMLGRYQCMMIVLGAVVANISCKRWLDKQDEATKKKAAWVALTVH